MLRILHISDFHICDSNLTVSKKLMESLTETLVTKTQDKEIDLIIFSGDAINKGGDKDESGNIKSFTDFEEIAVEPILKTLKLPKTRFILSPGNHDIQRNKIARIAELGLQADLTSEESIERNRKEFPAM